MNKRCGRDRDRKCCPFSLRDRQVALRLYFTGVIFQLMLITMLLVGGICLMLVKAGVITNLTYLSVIAICLVSVLLGTLLSTYISKVGLAPLLRLSQASQQVARGDFTARVDTDTRINEIRETCANFNAMVENLSRIETLSNDFVANVSHEFKTPINAIEGYAMLLQDRSLTPAERDDCVERILCNTNRLTALAGNILTLSKIENRGGDLELRPFRLDEQIRRSIVALEPKWSAKNIELSVDLPILVYRGNEGLLTQVWVNLLDNAVKFSPEGGLISVTAREDADRILVRVGDQGPGVDESSMAHIFDKFYQADTSHKAEGNGLGLALVREIAQAHGGSVSVENDGGAVFTVELAK
ncbi:MAG: HAMP domain-containing histidine kinase [Firmicutes bacterium]|nr:HAMP domain-containing histidine kinase [Bacillota bacterium]